MEKRSRYRGDTVPLLDEQDEPAAAWAFSWTYRTRESDPELKAAQETIRT